MSYTFRKVVGAYLKSFGYHEFNRPRMHQNVCRAEGWNNTTTVFASAVLDIKEKWTISLIILLSS